MEPFRLERCNNSLKINIRIFKEGEGVIRYSPFFSVVPYFSENFPLYLINTSFPKNFRNSVPYNAPPLVYFFILILQGGLVITPLTFRSERCYFMKSGSERCYSGHSRIPFLRLRGVIAVIPANILG